MSSHEDFFGPAISAYSRAQAIADGVLVDVSDRAREAGFIVPVALTSAVWADCIEWSDADTERTGIPQDEIGRLWDVVSLARLAARGGSGGSALFKVFRVPRTDRRCRGPKAVTLKLTCGPGDDLRPVITIMQPEED